MKTFYGDDGNYEDIPLEDILDRMTDDWIDDNITGANISELRDACRKLLETAHDSDYAKCTAEVLRYIKYSKDSKAGRDITEIIKKHFA